MIKIIFLLLQLCFEYSQYSNDGIDKLVDTIGTEKTQRLIQLIDEYPDKKDLDFDNKTDESDYYREAAISVVKKILPITLDEYTTLSDVNAEGNVIVYQYEINGMTPDEFLLPDNRELVKKAIVKSYCSDSPQIRKMKKYFNEGAKYTYYIDGKRILIVDVTTNCSIKK